MLKYYFGILLAVCFCANADAATYQYSGNTFDTQSGDFYTTSNRISGSFTINATLSRSVPLTDLTPLLTDYSFGDGRQVRTPANSTICSFAVSTDALGNIAATQIWLRAAGVAPGETQFSLEILGGLDLVGGGPAGATDCSEIGLTISAQANGAGTWEQVISSIPTNSPGGLLVLFLSLMGLAWLRLR